MLHEYASECERRRSLAEEEADSCVNKSKSVRILFDCV